MYNWQILKVNVNTRVYNLYYPFKSIYFPESFTFSVQIVCFSPALISTPPTSTCLLLSPSPSPHMPTISPRSIPPSLHPTRDYWFTHNLLFNIREQTFQNLCNLSISMCLSYGFVCASAESGCVCRRSFCLHPDAESVRSLWREREKERWAWKRGNASNVPLR